MQSPGSPSDLLWGRPFPGEAGLLEKTRIELCPKPLTREAVDSVKLGLPFGAGLDCLGVSPGRAQGARPMLSIAPNLVRDRQHGTAVFGVSETRIDSLDGTAERQEVRPMTWIRLEAERYPLPA